MVVPYRIHCSFWVSFLSKVLERFPCIRACRRQTYALITAAWCRLNKKSASLRFAVQVICQKLILHYRQFFDVPMKRTSSGSRWTRYYQDRSTGSPRINFWIPSSKSWLFSIFVFFNSSLLWCIRPFLFHFLHFKIYILILYKSKQFKFPKEGLTALKWFEMEKWTQFIWAS